MADLEESVSAILLSVGEATTQKALAALQHQSVTLSNISLVSHKYPFGAALNYGISKVETPYFIQCDADMVLDPDCVELLLRSCNEQAGMCYGYLMDPLLGPINGIKLYRTDACKKILHKNHFDNEVIFVQELQKSGWNIVNINPAADTTLGIHSEDLQDSEHLFERFKRTGIKIQHRKNWWDLAHRITMLSISDKASASIARDGIVCGLFADSVSFDLLDGARRPPSIHSYSSSNQFSDTSLRLIGNLFPENAFHSAYLIGTLFKRLRGPNRLSNSPLGRSALRLFSNWPLQFGFLAAFYHSQSELDRLSAQKRSEPFFEYLENKFSYHTQYAQGMQELLRCRVQDFD